MRMKSFLKAIKTDERGAAAIEYGLILALICLSSLAALQGLADENTKIWNKVSSDVIGASKSS